MNKGLYVGKEVVKILTNNVELKELIGSKIYPLVADANTTLPFIVYRRSGLSLLNSKDKFLFNSSVVMDLIIASDSYENSIDCLDKVVKALIEKKNAAECGIDRIELVECSEDFVDDCYVQNIQIQIKF